MIQIKRIEDCMEWMQAIEVQKWQSTAMLTEFLWQLSTSLAFVNTQMAIAQRDLNEKKVEAYHTLISSSTANEKYFAPSLAKDYVGARLSQEQYNYDLCERCSRCIYHTIEAVRSGLSALKMELSYSQNAA